MICTHVCVGQCQRVSGRAPGVEKNRSRRVGLPQEVAGVKFKSKGAEGPTNRGPGRMHGERSCMLGEQRRGG